MSDNDPTIFPTADTYIFDPVIREILLALAMRGWSAAGISVSFGQYRRDLAGYRYVRSVTGRQFRLLLGRPEGGNSGPDTSFASSAITVPRHHLGFYLPGDPIHYCHYVGRNWERDEQAFIANSFVDSRKEKRPRIYLSYIGYTTPQGKLPRFLAHTTDDGAEYRRYPWQANSYETVSVFQAATGWLQTVLLERLSHGA